MNKKIVVVAHNIRSTHNIGSLLRTCDGFGVQKVFFSGYTPYPKMVNDPRLPHISDKLQGQIHKTALGAEENLPWEYNESVNEIITKLKQASYDIVGLEQSSSSIKLPIFKTSSKIALLLGEEVGGLDRSLQETCDYLVEIPMLGKKESFNVTIASAIALYHFRFASTML